MARRMKKKELKHIALTRISALFSFAETQAKTGNINNAHTAVRIARQIAMKTTTSIPKKYKYLICKHCHRYLYPTISCRVRFSNEKKIITCFHCKKQIRLPYKTRK